MVRIFAHRIVVGDRVFDYSVATLSPDGNRVVVEPFAGESHSTIFVSGTVRVWVENGRLCYVPVA